MVLTATKIHNTLVLTQNYLSAVVLVSNRSMYEMYTLYAELEYQVSNTYFQKC